MTQDIPVGNNDAIADSRRTVIVELSVVVVVRVVAFFIDAYPFHLNISFFSHGGHTGPKSILSV